MRKYREKAERPVETAIIRDITADGRGVVETTGKAVFVDACYQWRTCQVPSFAPQKKL